jgi:Ca2+-transporting ATPase
MVPEQKLRLVQALQRNGEVVAMTGDGVNDAPALKTAQIGIAMGGRGTDVARESAALVLLDDDFTSIVEAIRTGRRIFDNLRGAMAYLLAIHVPIAGISILPVLLKLPLVLMPVHIAFLHLIIEPACSIVFEAEPAAANTMKKMPRTPGMALFSKDLILPSLFQGLVVFGIVLGVFLISLHRGQEEREARALTFTTLIFANLGLILVNRSWSRTIIEGVRAPNKALWWVLSGAMLILVIVLYVPFVRNLFRFSVLHALDLAICFGAGVVSIAWFEGWKLWKRRNHR